MHKTKKVFLSFCVMLCGGVFAQDEERYRIDTTENFTEPAGSVHILRLKKSYALGDGITLRSANGSFNISQSLQTLYAVNSAYKNVSNLSSTFSISRARLSFAANLFDKKFAAVMRLNLPANYQSTTSGNRSFNTVLQEAYFEYRPSRKHTFNIGLRADYIDSRETRIEGESLGFVERSAVSGAL